MNRFLFHFRNTLRPSVFCAALLAIAGSALAQTPAPNIIFFLADDMGLGDTSAYQDLTGNADQYQIDTPNIERLAALGTRFTDAHSNAAVCTPTRLSLLTGTHAFRSPIKQKTSFVNQDTIGTLLQGNRQTVAHMLSGAGYGTYGIGKWHMGLQVDFNNHQIQEGPVQSGFDHYTGTPGNFPGTQGIVRDNDLLAYDASFNLVPFNDPTAITWDPTTTSFDPGSNQAITEHIQQTNLDAAQQYLTDHVADRPDDPFFLYYASHANHTPFLAGDTLEGETVDGFTKAGAYLDVPTTTGPNGPVPTGPLYGDLELTNHWDPYLQTDAQGNVIESGPVERARLVDENDVIVGKLLDHLEATDDPRNPGHKLIDNTLIVFTSDNGSDIKSEPSVGALPQSSDGVITDIKGKKATFEEGGTRVPFIAAWAGEISAGATSDALFGLNDIYATLADVAGETLADDEAVDSESVLEAFRGNVSGDFRDSSLVYKSRDRLVIRRGDLKLVARDPDADTSNGQKFDGNLDFQNLEVFRFYDLSVDGGETTNLSNNAAFAATIASMLAELQGYVDAGFTRTGAVAIGNGVNFQGGDLLTAANYQGYGDGGNFELPVLTATNPNFVFVDGTATARVTDTWLIQGNGNIDFTSGQAGLNNTRWEIRGGSITSTPTAFHVRDGALLTLDGGHLDMAGNILRLEFGDGTLELIDGDAEFDYLTLGRFGSATAGSKIIRFGDGPGATLTLLNADPLRFGTNDGDTTNDFIDFTADSNGRIVASTAASYFSDLWDNGQLRIDGVDGSTVSQTFTESFAWFDLGGGQFALSLRAAAAVGISGDYNGSGQVEQGDLDLVLLNWGRDTDVAGIPIGWVASLPVGLIDQQELDGVLLNWGNTSEPGGASSVPEPGTAAWFALTGVGGVAFRRRRVRPTAGAL